MFEAGIHSRVCAHHHLSILKVAVSIVVDDQLALGMRVCPLEVIQSSLHKGVWVLGRDKMGSDTGESVGIVEEASECLHVVQNAGIIFLPVEKNDMILLVSTNLWLLLGGELLNKQLVVL